MWNVQYNSFLCCYHVFEGKRFKGITDLAMFKFNVSQVFLVLRLPRIPTPSMPQTNLPTFYAHGIGSIQAEWDTGQPTGICRIQNRRIQNLGLHA